ncbi:hypothetical protein DCAR_0625027 [Daucus carota subsp. sativus]|uniref:DUF4283 domain-containing protein n=1 Tax=Daucus carota subsp. sativus TaxID=79200 RepID=A0A161XEY5_DAUCS|nr:hypothetical protein DCAR_0625027 [Daucus carota subsp. sativus]
MCRLKRGDPTRVSSSSPPFPYPQFLSQFLHFIVNLLHLPSFITIFLLGSHKQIYHHHLLFPINGTKSQNLKYNKPFYSIENQNSKRMEYNLAHVKAGKEQGGTTLHASNSNLSKETNESKHISQVKFDIFSHSTSKQLYSSPNPNVTSSNNENLECRQNKDTHQTESQSINYNENVIIKENGTVLVKPPRSFHQNALDYWKNSCMGYFENDVSMKFENIKDYLVRKYNQIGLINVYSHHLGYLVLQFDSPQTAMTAIDRSPLSIFEKKLHVCKWVEQYNTVYPLQKEKVLVELTKIPFCYWSIQGLCYICSAIGTPVAFDKGTLFNAINKKPSDSALVYVETMVGSSRPTVLMTTIPGHSENFMAMVHVSYLDTPRNCLMCLSPDHLTEACKDVLELISCSHDQSKLGENIFDTANEYISITEEESQDIAKTGENSKKISCKQVHIIFLFDLIDHENIYAGSQALEESSKGKKILHEDLTSAAKPSTRKSKRKVQKRGGKQVLSNEPIQRTVVLGLPAQPKFKGNLFP